MRILLCFVAVFISSPSFAIIGGTPVDWKSPMAQTMVSLAENSNQGVSRSFCSAVLITDHTVITAAHCLLGKNAKNLWVVLGTNGYESQDVRPASKIVIHPNYSTYSDRLPSTRNNNDLALLFFEGGISNGYRPALLATSTQSLSAHSPISIAGFGDSDHGILNACETQVQNAQFSESEIQLVASNHCSPGGGDSGGATYSIINGRIVLYAIHNWGWEDQSSNPLYSVEASIPFHFQWIHSQL